MATLSENPEHTELEDFVAAHLVSRCAFVETGVTQRDPKDILELDVVWTDYARSPRDRNPIEVKSRQWHLGDLFKFYGWTQYLKLPPGQFICRQLPERLGDDAIARLCEKMGIDLIHVEEAKEVDDRLAPLGLSEPTSPWLPSLWRFSFWAQRRLRKVLNLAIQRNTCPESAKAAKNYDKLINDVVFFESDPRARVEALFSTHQDHRKLALTAANELGGRPVNFEDPPECDQFRAALYHGQHLPIQACMYLAHRGRLAVLKAAVDYYLAREAGVLPEKIVKFLDFRCDVGDSQLYGGFTKAVEKLAAARSFACFPTFWQVFLWGWGGFLLTDRIEDEYAALSQETGVPVEEIPVALTAFDELFVGAAPWFIQPANDTRKLLKIMPCCLRGLGAYSRLLRYGVEHCKELGFEDDTARRMAIDNDTGVRLLDGDDDALAS